MLRNGLLIFNSVHKVMRAEKALKREGLDVRVMPVPRQLSSDCGLSIAFRLEEREAVEAVLSDGESALDSMYMLEGEEYKKI